MLHAEDLPEKQTMHLYFELIFVTKNKQHLKYIIF